MATINERLRKRAKRNKMSLSDLSRQTGVPYKNLYHSLSVHGRDRALKPQEFVAVCKALDLKPEEVIE